MQTVTEQLVEALESLSAGMWEGTREVNYSYPKVEGWQVRKARAALDRAHTEPECKCDGPECPGYQEGANEGHSMGCNDDSCTCWGAGYETGHQDGLEALLTEAGQARRELGERVRDGK